MKKRIYSAVILLAFAGPALVAASEDQVDVHGTVDLGVRGVNETSNNSARFQEFRDIDAGLTGGARLDATKGSYYFQLDATQPGWNDQFYEIMGGQYGIFKYRLSYDGIPHNYSFNARSFYTGLGSTRLVWTADQTDVNTWYTFDYDAVFKKYGGELEASFGSPFYAKAGAERRTVDGTRPYSTRLNIEVPEPLSYTTDDVHLKLGYLNQGIAGSITAYHSSFSNDDKFLSWDDAAGDLTPQNLVLRPENDYTKFSADFSWRDLPLKSLLAAAGSYATLENDFVASDINVNAVTWGAAFNNLNRTTFEGDIDYTSLSASLSSNPLTKFDIKIYYGYLDRDNSSSRIFYDATTGDNAKELLSYEKDTAGIEMGYRLPVKTKLEGGYENQKIDRSTEQPAYTDGAAIFYRYGSPESTTDDTVYVLLKNRALDQLAGKLRYKHLARDSDYTYNPATASRYADRFDVIDKSMDEWKLSLEYYPLDRLDVGLDLAYKHDDYDANRTSRNDDKRRNVYLDLAWRAWKEAALTAFWGYETVETLANRVTSITTQATPLYAQEIDDDFWTYGLALNVPEVVHRLTLDISWQYQESDGEVNFDNSLTGTTYQNIIESDDYTKRQLEAKATYAFDSGLDLTLGYLYERYEYRDIHFENYQYILGADFYSGAYADQGYEANVTYLTVRYGF